MHWELISYGDSDARVALDIREINGNILVYTDSSGTVHGYSPEESALAKEFLLGTQSGFEITFVDNSTGSGFDDFVLSFNSNDDMPYSVQTGTTINFFKGFNVGTGWQDTGNKKAFVCNTRTSTGSDFTDDIVTAWNNGDLTSQNNTENGVRSDTNKYVCQLKDGDSNTVQFFNADGSQADFAVPAITDSGWDGNTLGGASRTSTTIALAGLVFPVGSIVHFSSEAYMYLNTSTLTTTPSSPLPSAPGDWKKFTP